MPASVFRNTGDGYSYVTLSDAEYEEYKTGALHHYIHTGQSKQDIVNFIKKNKVNTNNFDRDGHNALLVACKMQRFDLARHLVDKRRARVNTPERSKGITPLMYAAQNNDVPLCRYLISRKADINLVGKGILDSTALTLALTVNNGDVAKLLIERQAKIDVADSSGYTPLHLAAAYGRHKVVQMLIRRKAQVLFCLPGMIIASLFRGCTFVGCVPLCCR